MTASVTMSLTFRVVIIQVTILTTCLPAVRINTASVIDSLTLLTVIIPMTFQVARSNIASVIVSLMGVIIPTPCLAVP